MIRYFVAVAFAVVVAVVVAVAVAVAAVVAVAVAVVVAFETCRMRGDVNHTCAHPLIHSSHLMHCL